MWSDAFASLSLALLVFLWSGALSAGWPPARRALPSASSPRRSGCTPSRRSMWRCWWSPAGSSCRPTSGRCAARSTCSASGRSSWPACSVFRSASGCWCGPTRTAQGRDRRLSDRLCGLCPAARRLPHIDAGRGADAVIGFISGIMGGLGGYNGVLPAVWSQLRGWSKEEARAVYQPFIVVVHIATIAALAPGGRPRGLVLLAWPCRRWRSAPGSAGISTVAR